MDPRIKAVAAISSLVAAALAPRVAAAASPDTAELPAVTPTTAITTWSAADDKAGGSLTDVTVRNLVHTTAGGTAPQIRISNYFGTSPITFQSAYVGTPQDMTTAALVPGTNRQVTFGGSPSVTIPAGGAVISDPLPGQLAPGTDLAISLALKGTASVITAHNRSMQYTFKSITGDHAADETANAYGTQSSAWYFLDGVIVHDPAGSTAISALGDSITDGVGSTINANHRWTDYLAQRLNAQHGHTVTAIANEGISGNRVASGGGSTGSPGETRLTRDALSKPGIGSVFLFEGINDISGGISAAQLIAADKQIASQAHAMGKCVYAATLTPANMAPDSNAEAVRRAVNRYLRTTTDFDAVFDFDSVVRDHNAPTQLANPYDSGDHIHLSDTGYQAVANSIDLPQLHC